MPKYIPLDCGLELQSSQSDVLEFKWSGNRRIVADFLIPKDDARVLRVLFDRVEIVRLLDEMPLSTEPDTSNEGLVPEHLAYSVEDAAFWLSQSEFLKIALPSLRHYRFITGWTCLDVISGSQPTFFVVKTGDCRAWDAQS